MVQTRSSWLNCALRDDEAVYWVSIGHYEAVAVGNWWYWVSRGHSCLYILQKVDIWKGVTHAWQTDWLTTLKDSATQLLRKYKSGALVTQIGSLFWQDVRYVIFDRKIEISITLRLKKTKLHGELTEYRVCVLFNRWPIIFERIPSSTMKTGRYLAVKSFSLLDVNAYCISELPWG